MPSAIERIVERRASHRSHGYDTKNDLRHGGGELWKCAGDLIANGVDAAFEYSVTPKNSVWIDRLVDNRTDRVDALIEAAAMLVAEIERIEADAILAGDQCE